MKTIEINQEELTKYIYTHCVHYFYHFQEGECCQRKVTEETCSLDASSEQLNWPLDCPRLNTKEYGGDEGRCPKVKATIKKLKA